MAEYEVGVADLEGGYMYVTRVPDSHKESEQVNALFDRSQKIKTFVIYGHKKVTDDIDRMVSPVERVDLMLEGTVRRDPEKEFSKLMLAVRRHLEWSVSEDSIMHPHGSRTRSRSMRTVQVCLSCSSHRAHHEGVMMTSLRRS